MTQYNTLNAKLSDSQLNKLKSGIQGGTEVTLNLSSSVIGDSNDGANFSHKLLLTDTQVSRFHKVSANGSSANIKFQKFIWYSIYHADMIYRDIGNSYNIDNNMIQTGVIFVTYLQLCYKQWL